MPTYQYRCSSCGHEFELVQRITEPPARTCERCHKDAAARQICSTTFILKGGGWYADGYNGKGARSKTSSAETSNKGDTKGASHTASAD